MAYFFVRNEIKCAVSGILLSAYVAGCAVTQRIDKNYGGPKLLPEAIRQEYSYDRQPLPAIEAILDKEEKYTLKRVTFPARSDFFEHPHNIVIDYYDINGNSRTPGVFVLPILGGNNDVAKMFASYFAKKGIASFIVHRQGGYKKMVTLENIDNILHQIVQDHMLAVDWACQQKDIDSEKLGTFGVSMGGINSAVLAGLEDRLKVHVSALSGCNLSQILTKSNEKGIRKKVKSLMESENLTIEQVEKRLADSIMCDPKNYAKYADARNVLLILGVFDKTVPYRNGAELRQAFGGPETIYLLSGHYSAIIYVPFVKKKAYDFFRKKFNL